MRMRKFHQSISFLMPVFLYNRANENTWFSFAMDFRIPMVIVHSPKFLMRYTNRNIYGNFRVRKGDYWIRYVFRKGADIPFRYAGE